jgi:moderate conductance mechanosensitive channel
MRYGTDIDLVKKLIRRIGQELLDDPDLGPNPIETLKSGRMTLPASRP